MQYQEITEQIIECAYRVYNKMRFGFQKSVYEKCLLLELTKVGLKVEAQKAIKVYDGEIVGLFTADLVVEDTIILELISVRKIMEAHEVQLANYLVATGKPVALLINFGETKVDVKRKIRELPSERRAHEE